MNSNTTARPLIPVYSGEVPHSSGLSICACKTGYMVKPVYNLDRSQKAELYGFARNPETKRPIHAGLAKLRATGCYVLVKEEGPLRWASVVSDEEAYRLIVGAGKAALLKTMRFSRLLCFLADKSTAKPWTQAERWERVKWTPSQLEEIERRSKYMRKPQKGEAYVYQ